MALFKCKMCGGNLAVEENMQIGTCEYCGSTMTIPRLDTEKRTALYDRANHYRRINEYDKATALYEQILLENPQDAEAYWSIALCKYGIEYVEDSKTHRRVPTCNRTQATSILSDEDYRAAVKYAQGDAKKLYEEEGKVIDRIIKDILAISSKEEPFDIFICYKETDHFGKRTPDSVLAQDIYYNLTQEGYKVFFSRITLENKAGIEYEPYIFAALNSADIMIVLGTKPEYFNAVWVKNEWSRFLGLIKNGAKKTLIPAYKEMNPYDLPEEFSYLQAQDMGKIGFLQDLIHGIRKLKEAQKEKAPVQENSVSAVPQANMSNVPLENVLERAYLNLDFQDWEKADGFFEQALYLDPRSARTYVGKLLAELKLRKEEDLGNLLNPLDENVNFQKALRFADEDYKKILEGYNQKIYSGIEEKRLADIYSSALDMMNKTSEYNNFMKAAEIFAKISDYKDAAHQREECLWLAEQAEQEAERLRQIQKKKNEEWMELKRKEAERKEQLLQEKLVADAQKKKKKQKLIIQIIVISISALIIYYAINRDRFGKSASIEEFYVSIPGEKAYQVPENYDEVIANLLSNQEDFEGREELSKIGYSLFLYFYKLKDYETAAHYFAFYDTFKENTFGDENLLYTYAEKLLSLGYEEFAAHIFGSLEGNDEAQSHMQNIFYMLAESCEDTAPLQARMYYGQIFNYKDSKEYYWNLLGHKPIDGNSKYIYYITKDGNIEALVFFDGYYSVVPAGEDITSVIAGWKEAISIVVEEDFIGYLNKDGVVSVSEEFEKYSEIESWQDITSIASTQNRLFGLKADGTVESMHRNYTFGTYKITVKDYVQIVPDYSENNIAGLTFNGTRRQKNREIDPTEEPSICVSKYGKGWYVIREDGTMATNSRFNFLNQDNLVYITNYEDIENESDDRINYVVGLNQYGMVSYEGEAPSNSNEVYQWRNIVHVYAGKRHIVGIDRDGNVFITGEEPIIYQ